MKIENLNEHTQRTNDQMPKGDEFLTKEVLDKMSLEDLEKIRKEMEKRCDQRGSSRPVTHAETWLNNKKNETDYLCLVRDVIADKLEESSDVKTFGDFINEELDKPKPENDRSHYQAPPSHGNKEFDFSKMFSDLEIFKRKDMLNPNEITDAILDYLKDAQSKTDYPEEAIRDTITKFLEYQIGLG